MKKRERKTGRRFHAIANSQTLGRKPEELEPGVLACYVRQAEKKVLPIIKELKPGPAAAQFLLAQQTRVLVTQDYTKSFQPFTPVNEEPAHGNRQVAAGIVKHPETQLWQIWAIPDGPCVFLGAYADPIVAQRGLEAFINLSRRGGTRAEALGLYRVLRSQGDGEPMQLPFDMLKFLTERLHLYTIHF
jgi:hypothetical protein